MLGKLKRFEIPPLTKEQSCPSIKSVNFGIVKRVVCDSYEYLNIVIKSLVQCKSTSQMFEVPKMSISAATDAEYRLSEFFNHLLRDPNDDSFEIFVTKIFPNLLSSEFEAVLTLTKVKGPQSALYKHFVMKMSHEDEIGSVRWNAKHRQTDLFIAFSTTTHQPQMLWIDVERDDDSGALVLPLKSFQPFKLCNGTYKNARYKVIMAILNEPKNGYRIVVLEKNGSLETDKAGNVYPSQSLEQIFERICVYATSVVYQTDDIRFSELWMEEEMKGLNEKLLANSEKMAENDHESDDDLGSLASDDDYDQSDVMQPKRYRKNNTFVPQNSSKDSYKDSSKAIVRSKQLVGQLKKANYPVNDNMTPVEQSALKNVLSANSCKAFQFDYKNETYALTIGERNKEFYLLTPKDTTVPLCRKCLMPERARSFIFLCEEHVDESVRISVALVVSRAKPLFKLAVMKIHCVTKNVKEVTNLLTTEAKNVLRLLKLEKSLFYDSFDLDLTTMMTFRAPVEAESYKIALQTFHWMYFKMNTSSEAYFSQKVIGIGKNSPLADINPGLMRKHFNNLCMRNQLELRIESNEKWEMSKADMKMFRFRPMQNRNCTSFRPDKNRYSIYNLFYEPLKKIYYGRSSEISGCAVSKSHSANQERNSILQQLTKESNRVSEENCFLTKDEYVLSALESAVQLSALLAQGWEIPHVSYGVVVHLTNCGVESFERLPPDVNFIQFLNRVMRREYGTEFFFDNSFLTKINK